jgi:hypothetical protein
MMKMNLLYLALMSMIVINSVAFADYDFLEEGISGSISAIKIQKALENPDKTFKEKGHTYKVFDERIPSDLLQEMAQRGESIHGRVHQTYGPNGIGWEFHYGVPATYDEEGNLMWSTHPHFAGATLNFQLEDVTPHTSPAWYKFWK